MVLLALGQVAVLLLTGVVFLMWIHAAYRNLALAGPHELHTTPGWAVGSYFIPIANVYYPFAVMKEIWLRSADANSAEGRAGSRAPWKVRLWWSAFLGTGILGWIGLIAAKVVPPLDALERASWFLAVALLFRMAAAALLLSIVPSIDRMQLTFPEGQS